jgi:hypothetical protein
MYELYITTLWKNYATRLVCTVTNFFKKNFKKFKIVESEGISQTLGKAVLRGLSQQNVKKNLNYKVSSEFESHFPKKKFKTGKTNLLKNTNEP